MGAVVVLGLEDGVLPTWYAWLSAVLTAFVLGMTLLLALPYSAGVVAPVGWSPPRSSCSACAGAWADGRTNAPVLERGPGRSSRSG